MIDVREAEAGRAVDAAVAKALGWIEPKRDRSESTGKIVITRRKRHAVCYKTESVEDPNRGGDQIFCFYHLEGGGEASTREFKWQYPKGTYRPLKSWSRDIGTSWKLHNHVDIGEFLTALISVINYDRDLLPEDFNIEEPGMDWVLVDEDVWALATATPHQRARAFLLAHGVTEIEVGDTD
jgi:hypothetical protein